MAKTVLTTQFLSLGGTDLSAYIKKAELSWEADAQETTTYGDAGSRTFLGGLKKGELSIEFLNDYTDNLVDEIMWGLIGTVVAFVTRPTSAAVGVSNPNYTGSVLITKWQPIGGGVGDVANASVSYPTTGAVSRATS